ncbi:MAG: lipocalin family protein [Dyadobacter sp.]|uniref:lipocalin family protein n=1 Tax=Dyadobacter sp. TaxID=1914288 RepID=UPI0032671B7F
MKKLASYIAIIAFFGLTAFECGDQEDCCVMPPCSEKSSLTGTWRLESYQNISTGAEDKDPEPDGKGVVFTFKDDGKEGTIAGHTFVNDISGNYTLAGGCSVKITGFGGTKVGEPGWSSKAWLNSNATANFQVSENRFILTFPNATERLVFKKTQK